MEGQGGGARGLARRLPPLKRDGMHLAGGPTHAASVGFLRLQIRRRSFPRQGRKGSQVRELLYLGNPPSRHWLAGNPCLQGTNAVRRGD